MIGAEGSGEIEEVRDRSSLERECGFMVMKYGLCGLKKGFCRDS